MKIQIISEGSTKFDYSRKRWGLSLLIDSDVLFDTFCSGDLLQADMNRLGIDIKKIRHIILSHEHWDHTGGLWYILENNKDANVYVCSQFSDEFKNRIKEYGCPIIEVTQPVRLKDNLYTSGEIGCSYNGKQLYEQSLIIKQNNKLAVITGCSHPGILKILSLIGLEHKEKVCLLLGGLHLLDKQKEEISEITSILNSIYKIDTIAAFHCTGGKAVNYFRKHIPARLQKVKAGGCFIINYDTSLWEYWQ
jgi:7,8-dihydropterin-6-yl-methyl-4-(beta-D-ribofuranosyl)aminobenzene 5'-phosphate synthase